MSTIFIGGSRHVSRLPDEVKLRLDNVISRRHHVIVGDANGVDKAVQRYFFDAAYDRVTVFCSGEHPRNNLGQWLTHKVDVPKKLKGFHFYAAKDREMALEADFGLMIWDGKSPGTILNVLRLVRAEKIAVLFSVPNKCTINMKSAIDWKAFIMRCDDHFRRDLHQRSTPDEWNFLQTHPHPNAVDASSDASTALCSTRTIRMNLFGELAEIPCPQCLPHQTSQKRKSRSKRVTIPS